MYTVIIYFYFFLWRCKGYWSWYNSNIWRESHFVVSADWDWWYCNSYYMEEKNTRTPWREDLLCHWSRWQNSTAKWIGRQITIHWELCREKWINSAAQNEASGWWDLHMCFQSVSQWVIWDWHQCHSFWYDGLIMFFSLIYSNGIMPTYSICISLCFDFQTTPLFKIFLLT